MPILRLQERDLDMLHSLAVGHILTAQALEWLHFPAWRERWQCSLARGKGTYYPQARLYLRLDGLEAGGLVCRIRRVAEGTVLSYRRHAEIYGLTQAGAELLLERRGLTELDYSDGRPRAHQNIAHSVTIGICYAALRAALEYAFAGQAQPLVLMGWRGDHLLAQDYDTITVPGRRNPRAADGRWGLVPDATFQLVLEERHRRYFVEVDRGRRSLTTWLDKAHVYERYRGSAALLARYGVKDFVLLVVASTAQRLLRIAETIAKVQEQPGQGYLFILADQLHPLTIRSGFRRVEVQIERRVVAGKLAVVPSVTFVEQPLWTVVETAAR